MVIDIKQFALTGKFGPFEIGADKSEVIAILGEPDSYAEHNFGMTEIFYAWWELFFDEHDKLFGVQNDSYNFSDESNYKFANEKFRIEPWLMTSPNAPKFRDVIEQLTRDLIEFESYEYHGRPNIKLESGVVIDFDEEPELFDMRPLRGLLYWPDLNT